MNKKNIKKNSLLSVILLAFLSISSILVTTNYGNNDEFSNNLEINFSDFEENFCESSSILGDIPPTSGIWTITNPTTISDTSLIINGSILVESTGSLNITRSSIFMNGADLNITVEEGGELNLTSSIIDRFDENSNYFVVSYGKKTILRNTTFSYVEGFCNGLTGSAPLVELLDQFKGSIFIQSEYIELKNCSFLGNMVGQISLYPVSGTTPIEVSDIYVENASYCFRTEIDGIQFKNINVDSCQWFLMAESDNGIIQNSTTHSSLTNIWVKGNNWKFVNNTFLGQNGIKCDNTDGLLVENCSVISDCPKKGYTLSFARANNVNITNNKFFKHPDSIEYGGECILRECDNVIMENNQITELFDAIEIYCGENFTIKNNNFTNCYATIRFQYDEGNDQYWWNRNVMIEDNNLSNCTGTIYLAETENFTIRANILSECSGGIPLKNVTNGRIDRNTIINGEGLRCDSDVSDVNLTSNIFDNTISFNLAADTEDLIIYGNYFYEKLDVEPGRFCVQGENIYLNLGEIGNFWSYYDGVDINNDGIGDTPFMVNSTESIYDSFPIYNAHDNRTVFFPTRLPENITQSETYEFNITVSDGDGISEVQLGYRTDESESWEFVTMEQKDGRWYADLEIPQEFDIYLKFRVIDSNSQITDSEEISYFSNEGPEEGIKYWIYIIIGAAVLLTTVGIIIFINKKKSKKKKASDEQA